MSPAAQEHSQDDSSLPPPAGAACAPASASAAPPTPALKPEDVAPPSPPPGRLSPAANLPRPEVSVALPDGLHHVQLEDGSAYYGELHSGRMNGRGVFVWPNGARYEGEWRDGREDGIGTFVAADGSTFYGSWQAGRIHGEGVYKPAAAALDAGAEVVFLRQYDGGRMVQEQARVLRVAEKDMRKRAQRKGGRKKLRAEAKVAAAYRAPRPGEKIYKGHRSYDLMRELQLGLLFSIAQAGLQAAGTAILNLGDPDFSFETSQYFPAGAETAPYKRAAGLPPRLPSPAPCWEDGDCLLRVGARSRRRVDYLLSLTGDAALNELASPGKSGSVFFLSDDDRFIVKTVRKEEMRLLMELLPRYFAHVCAHPDTLLVHCYGVHRVSPMLGRNVRFIILGNVLPTDLRMHRRYDLKGSTFKRTVGEERRRSDPGACLKDLDLDMRLVLSTKQYRRVMAQLRADLALLEAVGVMDYSLLLGVHFMAWGNDHWFPPGEPWPAGLTAGEEGEAGASAGEASLAGSPLQQLDHGSERQEQGQLPGQQQWRPASAGGQAAAAPAGPADLEGAWALVQQGGGAGGEPAASAFAAADAAAEGAACPQAGAASGRPWGRQASIAEALLLAEELRGRSLGKDALPHIAERSSARSRAAEAGVRGGGVAAPPSPGGELEVLASTNSERRLLAAAADVIQSASDSRVAARHSAAIAARGSGADLAGLCAQPSLPDAAEGLAPAALAAAAAAADDGGAQIARWMDAEQLAEEVGRGASARNSIERAGPDGPPAAAGGAAGGAPAKAALAAAAHEALQAPRRQPVVVQGCSWFVPGCFAPVGGGGHALGRRDSSGSEWATADDPAPPSPPSPASFASASPRSLAASQAAAAAAAELLLRGAAAARPAPRPPLPAAKLEQRQRLARLLSHGEPRPSYGRAVPALAVRADGSGGRSEPVLLYFGIIDFLQDYTLRKRAEHLLKAAMHNGSAISVCDPRAYARRFLAFMEQVFLEKAPAAGA
eukprot:scaffold19.g1757.t1